MKTINVRISRPAANALAILAEQHFVNKNPNLRAVKFEPDDEALDEALEALKKAGAFD